MNSTVLVVGNKKVTLKYTRKMPRGEVERMKSFVAKNGDKLIKTSKFKSFIAKSQVTVGMSEKEILLSWGAPDRFMTRQGFDKVAVYTIKDVLIYYKNNKAVKIL